MDEMNEMEKRYIRSFLKAHEKSNLLLRILKNQYTLMDLQRHPSYGDHRMVDESMKQTEELINSLEGK